MVIMKLGTWDQLFIYHLLELLKYKFLLISAVFLINYPNL